VLIKKITEKFQNDKQGFTILLKNLKENRLAGVLNEQKNVSKLQKNLEVSMILQENH
jgi:hypothetical protein